MPFFFFFNDTATTEIYTLSLHDALPISSIEPFTSDAARVIITMDDSQYTAPPLPPKADMSLSLDDIRFLEPDRSEEHTSELQSRPHLVCRLLLENKKTRSRIGPRCSDHI